MDLNGIIAVVLAGPITEWAFVASILRFLRQQYLHTRLTILRTWYLSFLCLEGCLTCYLGAITLPLAFGPMESLSFLLLAVSTLALTGMLLFALAFLVDIEYDTGRDRNLCLGGMAILGGALGGILLTPSQFAVVETGLLNILFITLPLPVIVIGSVFTGYFTFFAAKIFGRMVQENRGTVLGQKFAWVIAGTVIHSVGFFVMILWGIIASAPAISLLFPYPSILGLLLLLKGLRQQPLYLIYLKQKAYSLIVFRPGGDVLFTYRFRKSPSTEEHYAVAALTGLNQFLQGVMQLSPQVMFDLLDLREYMVLSACRADLGLSLIVSGDSPVYRQSLAHMLAQLPPLGRDASGDPRLLPLTPGEQAKLNQIVHETFFFYPGESSNTEEKSCPQR